MEFSRIFLITKKLEIWSVAFMVSMKKIKLNLNYKIEFLVLTKQLHYFCNLSKIILKFINFLGIIIYY